MDSLEVCLRFESYILVGASCITTLASVLGAYLLELLVRNNIAWHTSFGSVQSATL